jgi:hypothetical protein
LKLTDRDLEVFSKHIGKLPFINMTKENAEILKSIVDELIEKRETQKKLIQLLEKADDYSDRLEWKLMMKDLPEITERLIEKRKERNEQRDS